MRSSYLELLLEAVDILCILNRGAKVAHEITIMTNNPNIN